MTCYSKALKKLGETRQEALNMESEVQSTEVLFISAQQRAQALTHTLTALVARREKLKAATGQTTSLAVYLRTNERAADLVYDDPLLIRGKLL